MFHGLSSGASLGMHGVPFGVSWRFVWGIAHNLAHTYFLRLVCAGLSRSGLIFGRKLLRQLRDDEHHENGRYLRQRAISREEEKSRSKPSIASAQQGDSSVLPSSLSIE